MSNCTNTTTDADDGGDNDTDPYDVGLTAILEVSLGIAVMCVLALVLCFLVSACRRHGWLRCFKCWWCCCQNGRVSYISQDEEEEGGDAQEDRRTLSSTTFTANEDRGSTLDPYELDVLRTVSVDRG